MTWDYLKREVDPTMLVYVVKALHRLQHKTTHRMQQQPHPQISPNYGA